MNIPQSGPTHLPWYKSKVIVGALVSAASKLLIVTDVAGGLAPGDEAVIAEAIVLGAGLIGDAAALGGRLYQRFAPRITAN